VSAAAEIQRLVDCAQDARRRGHADLGDDLQDVARRLADLLAYALERAAPDAT